MIPAFSPVYLTYGLTEMKIEIITSLNAELKETGFGSTSACADVQASIEKMGHTTILSVCASLNDLDNVVMRKPDLVILAAKYMPVKNGADVWFSDYFARKQVTFSGSNRKTLKYDSDKVLAKLHLSSLGIKTAKHFMAIPDQYQCESELPLSFPLFLKPTDAANGNGIDDLSFVKNFTAFEAKVLSLYSIYKQPILVEEYLSGKEFTVAIIKAADGDMTVSAIEVIPPESSGGLRILGATVKKFDTENLEKIDSDNIDCIKNLAKAAFVGLGIRGFGRIDVKMNGIGQCCFMEANLVPGMNLGSSYFPKACEVANQISYDEVVCLMLDECLERVVSERTFNKIAKLDTVNCVALNV